MTKFCPGKLVSFEIKTEFAYIGGWFVIRHSSGRCVLPNDQSIKPGTKIVLGTSDCKNQNYVFVWTAKRSIKHVISGLCINIQGQNIVLQNDCDGAPNTRFQYEGQQLISSGKTVQATQGGDNIGGMTLLATESSSSGPEAMFSFESKPLRVKLSLNSPSCKSTGKYSDNLEDSKTSTKMFFAIIRIDFKQNMDNSQTATLVNKTAYRRHDNDEHCIYFRRCYEAEH